MAGRWSEFTRHNTKSPAFGWWRVLISIPVPQQPLPFPRQGGRRLEWPPWPQQEEPPAPDESPRTRQGYLKCSCGHNKTDTRHSWPWHVDLIHRTRDSGGQWAWVSANPVGLSQRRSGGHWVRGGPADIESAAIRWRDLPRTARLGERQPGNPGTRQPAGGLERATAGGGYLPRSAGMRVRGQRTHGSRGDPAELPRRLAVGYGGITSGDFLAAGQTQTNRL